ncbi:MAG TPA: class I SAM-dependent methyltransferase [Actinomycetota bacterium]|nr:class I SAM-dependent methyltransferase [Actinomycetota bacterium]
MAIGRERGRRWLLRAPIVLVASVAAVVAARHLRGDALGRRAPGGILIADAVVYDVLTALALGPFYAGVADHVAALAPAGARVLEIGCGPGNLSTRLARHGLEVTGLDLDSAMIERARANAGHADNLLTRPSFLVGDVASLAFPDASFDLVVSTLSMHHWADPGAGLTEIGRVLRPGGRALVWDLRPGMVPFHADLPDPIDHAEGTSLRVTETAPWRWPFGFRLTQLVELTPDE